MWRDRETGQVVERHDEVRAMRPNVSLPAVLTDDIITAHGFDPFVVTVPVYDPNTQGVRLIAPILTGTGVYEQAWEVYALDAAQVVANTEQAQATLAIGVTEAIQKLLDAKAQEYEYDSIHTACGWVAMFPDASALRLWGAECWLKSKQIRDEVIAGTRPVPTSVDEVIAEMPAFVEPAA
jgi:hypothetical protein